MDKVNLTPAKLAELKKKAEAAADSPWIADGLEVVRLTPSDFDDETDEVHQVATCECVWNVEHIAAADPATVLAMVEEIAVLQRTIRNLVMKYQYDAWDDDIEYEIDQARHQLESEAGQ